MTRFKVSIVAGSYCHGSLPAFKVHRLSGQPVGKKFVPLTVETYSDAKTGGPNAVEQTHLSQAFREIAYQLASKGRWISLG